MSQELFQFKWLNIIFGESFIDFKQYDSTAIDSALVITFAISLLKKNHPIPDAHPNLPRITSIQIPLRNKQT